MAATPTVPAAAVTPVTPPQSKLLNIARARDDFELKSRISAALSIQATKASQWTEQSDASQRLSDYVMANPNALTDRMFNLLVTLPEVSEKIKRVDAQIVTSDITDEQLQQGVEDKWGWLADYLLGRGLI